MAWKDEHGGPTGGGFWGFMVYGYGPKFFMVYGYGEIFLWFMVLSVVPKILWFMVYDVWDVTILWFMDFESRKLTFSVDVEKCIISHLDLENFLGVKPQIPFGMGHKLLAYQGL